MNWRSVAPIRPAGLSTLQIHLGEGCLFGLVPMGVGRTYGFAYVVQLRFHDPLEGRLERLRHRFATFGGRVQEYLSSLDHADQIICSAMEWMEPEKWHSGRVVLVGDAAHASSPVMRQGGCMTMEDACTLADELRAAVTVESALASYVSRRKPRVKWVQQQSMALAEILTSPSAPRNAALRDAAKRRCRPASAPSCQPLEHDQTRLGMCRAEMFDTWSLESTKSGHRVRAFGDCRMDWRAKSYIGAPNTIRTCDLCLRRANANATDRGTTKPWHYLASKCNAS